MLLVGFYLSNKFHVFFEFIQTFTTRICSFKIDDSTENNLTDIRKHMCVFEITPLRSNMEQCRRFIARYYDVWGIYVPNVTTSPDVCSTNPEIIRMYTTSAPFLNKHRYVINIVNPNSDWIVKQNIPSSRLKSDFLDLHSSSLQYIMSVPSVMSTLKV